MSENPEFPSPLMRAAREADERWQKWSEAKKDAAARIVDVAPREWRDPPAGGGSSGDDLPLALRVRCISGSSAEREIVCRAADEIERLQGELHSVHAHLAHMRKESERLRAALDETSSKLEAKPGSVGYYEPTDDQVDIAARVFCNGFPLDSHPESGSVAGRIAKGRCLAPDCSCWEQGRELTRAALRAAMPKETGKPNA